MGIYWETFRVRADAPSHEEEEVSDVAENARILSHSGDGVLANALSVLEQMAPSNSTQQVLGNKDTNTIPDDSYAGIKGSCKIRESRRAIAGIPKSKKGRSGEEKRGYIGTGRK